VISPRKKTTLSTRSPRREQDATASARQKRMSSPYLPLYTHPMRREVGERKLPSVITQSSASPLLKPGKVRGAASDSNDIKP